MGAGWALARGVGRGELATVGRLVLLAESPSLVQAVGGAPVPCGQLERDVGSSVTQSPCCSPVCGVRWLPCCSASFPQNVLLFVLRKVTCKGTLQCVGVSVLGNQVTLVIEVHVFVYLKSKFPCYLCL